jgi:hypothetical protein
VTTSNYEALAGCAILAIFLSLGSTFSSTPGFNSRLGRPHFEPVKSNWTTCSECSFLRNKREEKIFWTEQQQALHTWCHSLPLTIFLHVKYFIHFDWNKHFSVSSKCFKIRVDGTILWYINTKSSARRLLRDVVRQAPGTMKYRKRSPAPRIRWHSGTKLSGLHWPSSLVLLLNSSCARSRIFAQGVSTLSSVFWRNRKAVCVSHSPCVPL